MLDVASRTGGGDGEPARRQLKGGPLPQFAFGEPARRPPDERFDGGHLSTRTGQDHAAAGRTIATQGGSARPASQRLLPRIQARTIEKGPGVEKQHSGIPRVGDRLGSRRADDEGGIGRHPVDDFAGTGPDHRNPWERPAELFRSASSADDSSPQ